MNEYDVIVVGGGPGGSVAAKVAAEKGLKVLMFERGRKSGEKNSSGCGLGPRMWRDFPEMMKELNIRPTKLHLPRGTLKKQLSLLKLIKMNHSWYIFLIHFLMSRFLRRTIFLIHQDAVYTVMLSKRLIGVSGR